MQPSKALPTARVSRVPGAKHRKWLWALIPLSTSTSSVWDRSIPFEYQGIVSRCVHGSIEDVVFPLNMRNRYMEAHEPTGSESVICDRPHRSIFSTHRKHCAQDAVVIPSAVSSIHRATLQSAIHCYRLGLPREPRTQC